MGPTGNWTYVGPITPGGPGGYWELPYLLPFDADGTAIENYHHQLGEQFVLAFGLGNSYWAGGSYDRINHSFTPLMNSVPCQSSDFVVDLVDKADTTELPTPVAHWGLNNGSVVGSDGAPDGHVSGAGFPLPTPGGGTGALFFPGTSVLVPYFAKGLDVPKGFAWSAMIQVSCGPMFFLFYSISV